MKKDFCIKTIVGHDIVLRFDDEISQLRWKDFGALIGLDASDFSDAQPDVEVIQQKTSTPNVRFNMYGTETAWFPGSLSFVVNFKKCAPELSAWDMAFTWQNLLTCALLAYQIRGNDILMYHGSLLEFGDKGILVCAESGVGKSTTARRWRECGGSCIADDMVLLEFCENAIFARPLPTWSQCRETVEGRYFPVSHRVRLAGALALSHADDEHGCTERIEPLSKTLFTAQFYRSAMYFPLSVSKWIDDESQHAFSEHVFGLVDKLCSAFPPRVYFSRLDGDLRKVFSEFLQ